MELNKLKDVRSKHANDKRQEIEKLKGEIEKVKLAKKERIKMLEKDTTNKLENLKKDSTNAVKNE